MTFLHPLHNFISCLKTYVFFRHLDIGRLSDRDLAVDLPERIHHQSQSEFLCLPIDLFWMISDLLASSSVAALSLTCKTTLRLFPGSLQKLNSARRAALLELLEKDLGHSFYYCHYCNQLHRYSSSWAVGNKFESYRQAPCGPNHTSFGDAHIAFHHVRLATNASFLGHGNGRSLGLDLAKLDIDMKDKNGLWTIASSAKIVDGELIVRMTHTLTLRGTPKANRRILEFCDHSICHHLSTNRPVDTSRFKDLLSRRIKSLEPAAKLDFQGTISQRDHELDWCEDCLTDCTTTIMRHGWRDEAWTIRITAYHQLGNGRDPLDWKWQTFSKPIPPPTMFRARLLHPLDGPGEVKRRWDQAGDQAFFSGID